MKKLRLDPKEWTLQHNLVTWTSTPQIYPVIGFPTFTQPQNPNYSPPWEITCNSADIN